MKRCQMAGAFQQQEDLHADKGAKNEDLAVGKIDKLQDPVNHGVAQGDQGVHEAQYDAVHEYLW